MEKTAAIPFSNDVRESDQSLLWHPYTQAQTAPKPIQIKKGRGARLFTSDNEFYIDAISSWWVNLHGHSHPLIAKRIAEQAEELEHVLFADFTHEPALQLASQLLGILPAHLSRIFFSDNGSTAIESALKIAFQYFYNQNCHTKRRRAIAFKHGFHGETIGAMSLTDRGLFTKPFSPLLFDVTLIDPPFKGSEAASIDQLQYELEKEDVACFFFEPQIQGVGGFLIHDLDALDTMIALCNKHGTLTIADEVMTGFGRTGPLFVSDNLQHSPDMICLAKALTGGFLPLGATVCAEFLFEAFLDNSRSKALLHGHSYTANPIACAAASANIELVTSDTCSEQRRSIEAHHLSFQQRIKDHPKVDDCRVLGTILALDYRVEGQNSYFSHMRDQLLAHFLRNRVLLRPFGNTLHIMPPYCISADDLNLVYQVIESSLEINE